MTPGACWTGRDEHGELFPIYFKAFGEYKNPVFIYACVPVIGLFGPEVFAVRLTSVLFGSLTVIAVPVFSERSCDLDGAG